MTEFPLNKCWNMTYFHRFIVVRAHIVASFGELFGSGVEGSFGARVDAVCRHSDHLTLFGRKLWEHLWFEPSEHQRLLEQQLQFAQMRWAGVIPPPRELQSKIRLHYTPFHTSDCFFPVELNQGSTILLSHIIISVLCRLIVQPDTVLLALKKTNGRTCLASQ